MSSGERPIGAAKGKQADTEALCQPPPPSGQSTRPNACCSGEQSWAIHHQKEAPLVALMVGRVGV